MKKIFTISLVFMLFGFTIKAQVLTLSRNAVQLSWQANSSDTIKVFSNTSWTCGFDQNWLTVSSAGGSGDSIISITVEVNPLTTSRTAHLIVSGTDVASQTVTITQAGSPLLSVSSDSLVIGALANSTCLLKITSLPDWSASSNQSWLTLQPTSFVKPVTYAGTYNASGVRIHPTSGNIFFSGLMEELTMLDEVTISKPNAGDYTVYTVQITLTNSTLAVGGKTMQVVNVSVIGAAGSGMLATDQSGNPTNYFDPSTRTFNLSYYYNTVAPRKIYEVVVGALTTTTVAMTATASANPTSENRQAAITITANGVPDKIVKVTQEASPVLAVSTNSLLLPAAANSSITFNINSVTDWIVESNQNWLSLSKTSGSNKDTIRVTATENGSSVARNAILTVTGTGSITRTINVTQYGKVPASGKWNQFYAGHNYTELSVVNDTIFWVCRSSDNTISYTLDGGKTWNTKNLPSNIPGNTAFCAVSGTTAYIACGSGTQVGIYKTTDGADTWTLEPTGFSNNKPNYFGTSFPDFVYFWDINNGLAYGDDNEIYITNNGGTEWNSASSTAFQSGTVEWSLATQAFYKVAGNTIYILVTNQNHTTRILKSNDKGLTWSSVSTPTNSMSASFDFKDDNNGLFVDYTSKPSKLYSTTTGGQNWVLINSTDNLHNLKYIPAQDLYISTNTVNGILYSADNGKTWIENPSFNFNNAATYNSVISPNGLTTFISGYGYVYSSQNIRGVNTVVDNISVSGSNGLDVTFSNSVELISANDTANYKLTYTTTSPGKSNSSLNLIKGIKVVSASRDDSNYGLVHLVTGEPLPLDTVSVSVNNIYDINGFPTINGSVTSVQTLILNFTLSTSALDIGAEANSTNTFSITSNLSWEISSDQSWLSPGTTSGTGNSTITLTAAANPENISRTAIVTVSSAGGTVQTVTVTQDGGTTGLPKIENSGVSVSPNPASTNLTIRGLNPNSIATIYDLKGKMLITRVMTDNQMDISNLPKGVYTLKVTDKNGIVTQKVIKQ